MKLQKNQIQDIHALTPMQEGMLYYYLRDPSSDLHFEQVEIELSGELEEARFRCAWEIVVKANPALRSLFRWEGVKEPVQVVLKEHKPDIRYHRLGTGENDRKEKFDLTEVPFRISLFETGEGTAVMQVSHHHILYDGWSTGIILKEFLEAYRCPSIFRPPSKALYKDYVGQVRSRMGDREEIEKWRSYRREYLKGFRGAGETMPMETRPERDSQQASIILGTDFTRRLEDYVKANKVTQAAIIYTAWGQLLQGYRGTGDEVFNYTRSGRNINLNGIENTVGMFIDTQAIRVDNREGESNRRLVERVQEHLRHLETMAAHPDEEADNLRPDTLAVIENYPAAHRLTKQKGDRQKNPPGKKQTVGAGPRACPSSGLQRQIINRRAFDLSNPDEKGDRQLNVEAVTFTGGTVHDMMLMAVPSDRIEFRMTYRRDRLAEGEAVQLLDYFVRVLERIVTHPDRDAAAVEPSPVKAKRGRNEEEERDETRQTPTIAPRTPQEQKLAEIWHRVLGRTNPETGEKRFSPVGIDDNFFDTGGHSLKASKLAAAVYKEFQVKLPLTEIFKNPTIRQQSRYIAETAKMETYRPVEPVEEKEYYPLTSAQKRMYLHSRLASSSTVYNGVTALMLDGHLDIKRMETAFNRLIKRHEVFRTMFVTVDGEPVQRVIEGEDYKLQITNDKQIPDNNTQITNMIENLIEPFDLSAPPLLRVELVRLEDRRHVLVVDMHHIVTDGVSEDIVIGEFMALYRAETLPPLTVRYRDFAQRQQERLESGDLEPHAAYWREHFAKPLPELRLPLDFPRPPVQSFEGDAVTLNVGRRLYRKIRQAMQTTGTTLFMVLLAVYNIQLSRYTGQSDIIVGTVTEGRDHPDIQGVVGLFVETLALRNKPDGQKNFYEFLGEVKETALQAYQNQDYPFRRLVRQLGIEVSGGRNPLFDVMLVVQNYGGVNLEIEGLTVTSIPLMNHTAKLDLYMEAWEKPEIDEIELKLEYGAGLFKRETMEHFLRHYVTLLEAALDEPSQSISELEMLTPEEIAHQDSVVNRENPRGQLEADFDF